jgi:hypothetical protein
LRLEIPADGEYGLLVAGSQKAQGRETFGNYRLLLGIDRGDVLDGSAQPTTDSIAQRNLEVTPAGVGVDELGGSLGGGKTSTVVALEGFKEGDTLYARLETTGGELFPGLQLNNFAGKPVRSSNLDGASGETSLQYTFPADAENYHLRISTCCGDENTDAGNFRLQVGVNEPAVMEGLTEVDGRPVIRRATSVTTFFESSCRFRCLSWFPGSRSY